MRLLLALIILVTITSCNHKKSYKVELNNFSDLGITDNKELFGTWAMCSVADSGTMTQMNVCPTITFKSDGTGYVEKGTIITESFAWTLKKNSFKISYSNKPLSPTLSDTNYSAYFSQQKEMPELVMRHNDQSYYLSKPLRR
jgi:hypothetical protein